MPFDENNFKNPKDIACTTCKHFIDFSDPPRCKAFPERIPDVILDGISLHRNPVRGDHGIQYEAQ